MPERLIDTNILVYAYDTSEGTKHPLAKELLKQIWQG
jgi:predicted nucleic acid-binding protein